LIASTLSGGGCARQISPFPPVGVVSRGFEHDQREEAVRLASECEAEPSQGLGKFVALVHTWWPQVWAMLTTMNTRLPDKKARGHLAGRLS